uniref:Uncharacterized protein n=1 Tax=Arundo donax TaxID=35708 RepID=A0A0A8ZSB2_ARUDO
MFLRNLSSPNNLCKFCSVVNQIPVFCKVV